MYTQCPECLTIYKIAAETLQSSHGKFRCGHCGGVFDALPSLTEKLPEGVVDELPRSDPADVPAVLSVPAMRPVRMVYRPGWMNDGGIVRLRVSQKSVNAFRRRIAVSRFGGPSTKAILRWPRL